MNLNLDQYEFIFTYLSIYCWSLYNNSIPGGFLLIGVFIGKFFKKSISSDFSFI